MRSAATLSRGCRALCSKAENASGDGRPEKTKSTGSMSSDPLVHHRLKGPYVVEATASRMRGHDVRTPSGRSHARRQRSLAPLGRGKAVPAAHRPRRARSGPRASRLRSTDGNVASGSRRDRANGLGRREPRVGFGSERERTERRRRHGGDRQWKVAVHRIDARHQYAGNRILTQSVRLQRETPERPGKVERQPILRQDIAAASDAASQPVVPGLEEAAGQAARNEVSPHGKLAGQARSFLENLRCCT